MKIYFLIILLFTTSIVVAFPNPTNGIIDISSQEINIIQIVVTDLFGQIIVEYRNSGINKTLDLSKYNNGIYFISVQTEEETSTIKILKQ